MYFPERIKHINTQKETSHHTQLVNVNVSWKKGLNLLFLELGTSFYTLSCTEFNEEFSRAQLSKKLTNKYGSVHLFPLKSWLWTTRPSKYRVFVH